MSARGATLVQLTDTHLLAGGALLRGRIDTWARTTAALGAAARFSPDAVLVTGDVSDRGAPVYSRAAELFGQAERELGCPVIVVPGNHDPAGAVGAAFNRRRLASGPNPADTVHLVAGLRIIGLETHGFREAAGRLSDRQLLWLRAVLQAPAPRGTVLAMHHPPIESLLPELAGRGLARPGELAAVLAGSDVRGILCGHYHLPGTGSLGTIPVWVSPAVSYNHNLFAPEGSKPGTDPSWFSVIKVGAGQFSATPVQVPVPAAAPAREVPVPARQPALL
ncbi:metallophosphoesterase [Paeniglutamicibacter sp. ABSL32-1]|uniref:metallophosphoesterase n=1 Tax=Paeniglutamicibacter quisquiliarum TaxID=2849498 RepID=UPI001C2D0154|nr:metallophosphoesterase [Paeniglutamicibacter quisquiliarum]MBV1777628.1 metallophosphoesterase [Paeniglutamicibacter quisquiliarum]